MALHLGKLSGTLFSQQSHIFNQIYSSWWFIIFLYIWYSNLTCVLEKKKVPEAIEDD